MATRLLSMILAAAVLAGTVAVGQTNPPAQPPPGTPASAAAPAPGTPPPPTPAPGPLPALVVESPQLALGNVKEGEDAVAVFMLRNAGDAELKILSARPG